MSALRVITDPPASGAWNMAVDEALLESAAERGIATLRFYQWHEPTLSLGYFQPAADREQHAASLSCPLVRRASGGGAIVHDRELTYSLAWPLRDVRAKAATELYDACHETLVAALADWNVPAVMFRPPVGACAATNAPPKVPEAFLCFERRTCGDILCGEHKIVGSAQRRRRRAVLQHGSILLDASIFATELPGIAQLTGRKIAPDELARAWVSRLGDRLRVSPQAGTRTSEEQAAADGFCRLRFAAEDYTHRR
jgi:lipoate-protein ligase A